MLIAGPAGRLDALAEGAPGVVGARKPGQKLAVLEVAGHVVGIFSEESLEILDRRGGIALRGAFHGQPVAGEGVLGMGR